MSQTKTQKKRLERGLFLVEHAENSRMQHIRKLGKQWRLIAEAADRRAEMRKGASK